MSTIKPLNRWQHFSHAADIGVRGLGPTKEAAFEQAAIALTAVITDPDTVEPSDAVEIVCEGADDDILLADWLNELIYEMATRRMLFSRFSVEIDDGRLVGTAWGETVDVARHQPAAEVKGATLTELEVSPAPGDGWRAQCIVDV